jgi:citrate synthase
MPLDMHPMALFSMGILALQRDSVFSQEYTRGIRKPDYWKSYLEDSLNLMAKLPPLAAYIYNRKYRNGEMIQPDPDLDWSGNFAHLIGKGDDLPYRDLCRLFFLIHSDHEGGNVSAHAAHLVSSALSDIYYSCSAGMNGLAGPLHGLANQECLRWIQELRAQFDHFPSREELEVFARDYIASGQVIPGYGHAVLRATDPRFTAQYEFAKKYLPDDELFRLVSLVYEVVPDVLRDLGKVKNPWPNVDAINGTLQYHYGVTEIDFYTVLFGVSRCMGLCAHATWARALGKPIERPKSLTTAMLEEMVKEDQETRLSQPSE